MNSFVAVTFLACLAVTNAGLIHAPHVNIVQGPSSKTTVVEQATHINHGTPVITHVAPAVSYESHSVPHHVPVVAHATQTISHGAYAAPVTYAAHHAAPSTVLAHSSGYEHGATVLAGHSGIISTGHLQHHAAPVVAYSSHVTHGHGHEGQYAHDYSETLYDDGSYKPHVYHH